MAITINVDIGGTFTDVLIYKDGQRATGKADTTVYNLTVGFMGAVEHAASKLDLSLSQALGQADMIKYSTTVGTNALIERSGPKLGLITTRGFEDTIHIGKSRSWADGMSREVAMDRPRAKRPPDLIPRDLRVGVKERIDCFGNIVMPLKKDEVLSKVQYLVDQGVRGIVVCLLWSFVNPVHEHQIRDIIREEYPEVYLGNIPVILSSEVSPKIDEYKRSVTAILDACLTTAIEEHFLELTDELRSHSFNKPVMVVRNTGGVASVSRSTPLHLLGAGPVAGILGASFIGKVYGEGNVLATDMGGTSFDFGMVLEGKERQYEFDPIIDRWRIQLPVISSISIGAGGGSIARLDEIGNLKVGPESAGAMPGPACYDKGGNLPTVTDADVVLGYINSNYFLGGRQRLNKERSIRAIRRRIADPLGLTAEEAAFRVRKLIDGIMGQEVYKQTALKGYDPREFVLFAFGGAGPVHCCGYAEYADVSKIITFPFGSVFNAFGASTMDILQTYEKSQRFLIYDPQSQSYVSDYSVFNQVVRELKVTALKDMREEGFDLNMLSFSLELDMRYARQIHSLRFTSPRLKIENAEDAAAVCDAFQAAFAEAYSKAAAFPEGGMEINNFKLNAMAFLPKPELPAFEPRGESPASALKGERSVFWDPVTGFLPTPVYEHGLLECGNEVPGPALIEAIDTVYVIPQGKRFMVDRYLNGLIEDV
ncbi:MAG: hydantoinase/oxoprolinase family protein [Dehalococcoidia bacterium]|nr:hydantoinase/oxoprolinase family protein [Dehalococcoidia bacterium]